MRKHVRDVRAMAAKALASGNAVQTGPAHVRWDTAGNCERPHGTDFVGRPFKDHDDGERHAFYLTLMTRCRKCHACVEHRARLWRARARAEMRAASRTWLVTLTLSPEEQFAALTRARRRQSAKGEDFERASPAEQFQRRHNAISPLITKYIKRVRKQSGAPLRYMLVAEQHKSGAPHYHMLVHEIFPAYPVRHRVLSGEWKHGFTQCKLADVTAARYVCKYLTKSNLARVRASLSYGDTTTVVKLPSERVA